MAQKTRPKDSSQLPRNNKEIATGQADDSLTPGDVKAAAAALGRLGGLKGGKARAKALTPEKRVEIARKAARARWHKN